MQQVLDFLNALRADNTREWFAAHRADYDAARARFDAFALQLRDAIAAYDSSVAGLTLPQMTYRIYRDVRFSRDKSPFKTHMGVYVCRGGKKSGYSGYYFHVAAEGTDTFGLDGHCMAAGDYCCEPRVLRVLREDIAYGDGAFGRVLDAAPHFRLDDSDCLKRVPRGFDADAPYAALLRFKVYCLVAPVPTSFVTAGGLAARVAEMFRETKPFLDFVNRAIDYVRDERRGEG